MISSNSNNCISSSVPVTSLAYEILLEDIKHLKDENEHLKKDWLP
ncbi:unnamed protein product, partial [Adineta steineri]